MILDINFYIFAAIVLLFITGIYCLLLTQNLIRILIALEVLTKAVTLFIIAVGYSNGGKNISQALVITLIIVEVVVMVVACGIILGACRYNKTLDTRNLKNLKG